MNSISGVKITVIGIKIHEDIEYDNFICKFYEDEILVSSISMNQEKIWNNFDLSSSFEYVKIWIQVNGQDDTKYEIKISTSFLNKLDLSSANEQWLPLMNSQVSIILTESDFYKYDDQDPFPAILLGFEVSKASDSIPI